MEKSLGQIQKAGAIMMDLPKAFDCVSSDLLIEKLKAYNLGNEAINLIKNYLTSRKQCVKIGNCISNVVDVLKGVPQGSIMGPIIFNIFINDILYFTEEASLINYADDNTLTFCHEDVNEIKCTLEKESVNMIRWFRENRMQANPHKFQAIMIRKNKTDEEISLCWKY